LLQRKKPHYDPFIFFRLRHAFFESAGQINRHAFIQKAWAHVKEKSLLPA
jgi:hypothetical protein